MIGNSCMSMQDVDICDNCSSGMGQEQCFNNSSTLYLDFDFIPNNFNLKKTENDKEYEYSFFGLQRQYHKMDGNKISDFSHTLPTAKDCNLAGVDSQDKEEYDTSDTQFFTKAFYNSWGFKEHNAAYA